MNFEMILMKKARSAEMQLKLILCCKLQSKREPKSFCKQASRASKSNNRNMICAIISQYFMLITKFNKTQMFVEGNCEIPELCCWWLLLLLQFVHGICAGCCCCSYIQNKNFAINNEKNWWAFSWSFCVLAVQINLEIMVKCTHKHRQTNETDREAASKQAGGTISFVSYHPAAGNDNLKTLPYQTATLTYMHAVAAAADLKKLI